MKVALIFVRDRRFYWRPSTRFSQRRLKKPYPGNKPHYVLGEPPLGIMYLSAVLKQAGHEVTLTDQCHPEYSDEKYVEGLGKMRPDLVGISFLSNLCYQPARRLARLVKTALPDVPIVCGGVFPTINARKIIENEVAIDIVARGEGEGIICDLAADPDNLENITGITYRSSTGAVRENPAREQITDLDSLPFPDRDSLDIHYVAALPLDVPAVIWDRPYTTIVSSRGCPFDCTYCNCPVFSGRKVRVRSAANVLQELEEIAQQGYGAFSFLDDNFLIVPQRVHEICDGMVERRQSFKWACEGRVDHKGNGIFRDIAAAGCDLVMFGIESGSQRILDEMKKRTKLSDIERSVAQAKQAGIGIVHGFFIVGSPSETIAEVEQTFAFAERLPLNSFNFNSLTAFRGTPLWTEAVARGLIDDDRDWDKMFPVHEIYPDTIDSKTLFRLRSRLVKRLVRRKIVTRPRDAARLFGRFLNSMSMSDLIRLLSSSQSEHQTAKS